jgi:hypothetical protein
MTQRLQRAPADLAQVPVIVWHELLAVARTIDTDARPSKIAVGFAQTKIANEDRFGSHDRIRAANNWTGKQQPPV